MASAEHTITWPAERLPVLAEADVVVAGGGSSGFIAATAAARSGACTLLAERWGYLGGCTTAPYNTSLNGFNDMAGRPVVRGLAWEFVERMERDGQAVVGPRGRNQLWPVWTRKVALDMVAEAGVELWLHTWVSDVIVEDGTLRGLVVQTKRGRGVLMGRVFVDATGDADVAARAGAPFEMTPTDALQQVSCDYLACGVDAARVLEWARAHRESLVMLEGAEEEHRPFGAQPMLTFVIPGALSPDGYPIGVMPTVKLCIYREAVRLQGNVEVDPLDPRGLTQAEVDGLRGALEHLSSLQEHIPGFEHAFLVAQHHLGVRESRRILGEVVLTLDDVRGAARFEDVVALNCRHLDYHLKGTVFRLDLVSAAHDIPLRALVPQRAENLLVCGRSISCDHLAQASLRGAATCMATGHAAGTAAALAAKGSGQVRELDVPQLQETLLRQGAILRVGP